MPSRNTTANLRNITLTAILAATPSQIHARFDTIAAAGDPIPVGTGTFDTFNDTPALNDNAQVIFNASLTGTTGGSTDDTAIFIGSTSPTPLSQIVREGDAPPDADGFFGNLFFANSLINQNGTAAFLTANMTSTANTDAVFTHNGSSLSKVARTGGSLPTTVGTFSTMFGLALNNEDKVAFFAFLSGTPGGTDDNVGIYFGTGFSLKETAREGDPSPTGGIIEDMGLPSLNDISPAFVTTHAPGGSDQAINTGSIIGSNFNQVAREGDPAPGGSLYGSFGPTLNHRSTNNLRQVAYTSFLDDDTSALFVGDSTSATRIKSAGQPAPDGNGTFFTFMQPQLSNTGFVAYAASFIDTIDADDDNQAILRYDGFDSDIIAREGQPAPDGNGTMAPFSNSHQINNTGQVLFGANFLNTDNPGTDTTALLLADTQEQIIVAREGNNLSTGTITNLIPGASINPGGRSQLNRYGQVSFFANTTGGHGIFLYTPDLHWRSTSSGNWSSNSKWTVGLEPAHVHDVFIDPNTSLTVNGPTTDTHINSLTIGGNPGIATLNLNAGIITTDTDVQVLPTGKLTGDGAINNNVNSTGTISADNVNILGDLSSAGTVNGNGRIAATSFINQPAGRVLIGPGQSIDFDSPLNTNAGQVEILEGNVNFNGDYFSQPGSRTLVIDGIFHANGPVELLPDAQFTASNAILNFGTTTSNINGTLAFSFGSSFLSGPILNLNQVSVAGASNLTFIDNVSNHGDIFVGPGSHAVYLGDVDGPGNYPGSGTNEFTKGISPGASPGTIVFGGDVVFGPFATVKIEAIATTTAPVAGTDNDLLDIANNVTFNGTLNIIPLPDATPIEDTTLGNEYLFMTFTSRTPNSFFSDINGTLINTAFALAPLLNEPAGTFTLRATIPGDLNLDNRVSVADLASFALNFNTTPGLYDESLMLNSWELGDFNNDGIISVTDLSLMALNFGFDASDPTSAPLGLSIYEIATIAGIDLATIPEPATAAILITTIPCLARLRRNS